MKEVVATAAQTRLTPGRAAVTAMVSYTVTFLAADAVDWDVSTPKSHLVITLGVAAAVHMLLSMLLARR